MVLYTLLGGISGGVIMSVIGRMRRFRTGSNGFFPSDRDIGILFGTLVGGCIGFGYGASAIANGTHAYNKMYNRMKDAYNNNYKKNT